MSFTPNYLSQRDPRWKDEQLGFDNTITIGTDGCALTSLAMLVNGYGFTETPSSLNQKLKAMGAGGGFIGGLVVWGSLTRAFPKIVYQNIIQWNNPPAALNAIDVSLDTGQPVVVEIDRSPSPGLQNHWVVLYAKQGDDYLMLDPWSYPPDSTPTTLAGRYGLGRQPQDFILAGIWYLAQGTTTPPAPPSGPGFYVQVDLSLVTGLNLRSAPSVSATLITRESAGSWLKVLEPAAAAQAKIGSQDQWLNVQDPQGQAGYVAAWYVHGSGQPAPTPAPTPAPAPAPQPVPPSGWQVYVASQVTAGLRLRDAPSINGNTLAIEPVGVALSVLEPAAVAQAKVGVQDQWLNVRDPQGKTGYAAAWLVELQPDSQPSPAPQPQPAPQPEPVPQPAAPSGLIVLVASLATAGLRLRDGPSMDANPITVEPAGGRLSVLEPAGPAQAKIGQQNQWLNVQDEKGNRGYVAAWLVELEPDSVPAVPAQPQPELSTLTVIVSSQATAGLRLRDQPNANGNILKSLGPGTPLKVLEPAAAALAKVGQQNQWLNVQEPGGTSGYVAAWFVTK